MLWAVMANLIYLSILIFATYGIGKKLYNFEIGIIAAFLVSLLPGVFAISRCYLLDLAFVSFVTLSLYMMIELLNSEGKRRFFYFFLTTFSITSGLLIKESYFYFLPLLSLFLLIKREYICKKNIISVFAVILLALLLVSRWYFRFGLHMIINMWRMQAYFSNNDNLFYVKKLYEFQLMPIFFWFLLISIIHYLIKKDLFPIIFVVFPLVAFSMILQNKDGRFILPIFSFIALVIARTLWDFTKGNKFMISFFLVLSLLQFFLINYSGNQPKVFAKLLAYYNIDKVKPEGIYGISRLPTYKKTAQVITELINFLDNKCLPFNKDLSILVLAESGRALYFTMEELLASGIKTYNIMSSVPDTDIEADAIIGFVIEPKVTDYKYLVCENPPNFTWENAEAYYNDFLENIKRYSLIRTIQHSSEIKFDLYVRDYCIVQD
jgi:hypothetical protein